MAPSSPMGLFGKLPREIRDEIYFQALGHVSIAGGRTLKDLEERKPLSILAVAPQISWEASQSLSSRSTLHFDGDAEIVPWEIYETFANIDVTLDADLSIFHEHSDRGEKLHREMMSESSNFDAVFWTGSNLLSDFTGARIAREVAQLRFCPIGGHHAVFSRFENQPPLICSEKLRGTIKQLVGFREVMMVLEFVVKARDAYSEAHRDGGGHRDKAIWSFMDIENTAPFDDQDRDCFKRLTADVGKDFEKDLGAFTTHFVERPNGDFAGVIKYHPRKASYSRKKAAMADEEFSQILKRMVECSLEEERATEEKLRAQVEEIEQWAGRRKG